MSKDKKISFESTFDYKVIYIFRINDNAHKGCVKIGDATLHTKKPYSSFQPNCHELNVAARKRIDEYTITAGITYDLLYTEIAVYLIDQKLKAFRDHEVHNVLKRSGIKNKYFDTDKVQNEWFVCDLETAKNAIKAVKEGKSALSGKEVSSGKNPIIFRPEQKEAIKKTTKQFKSGHNRMLWNAKMRFGKTLSALEVVKQMGFKKTIIVTHRPVVNKGWFEDFNKIFYDRNDYSYSSKTEGRKLEEILKTNDSFVYFASMQDLRGASQVGGNFDKNSEVFGVIWDCLIVDEAHEGTQTELGKAVTNELLKGHEEHTKILELSGTPFNLLTDFEVENIYTWDYIMEQEAKVNWERTHFGDSNPYAELPKMNIFTYHLEKSLPVYLDVVDKAFNFKEFFRTWTGEKARDGKEMPKGVEVGDFIHENDIKAFLDLICKEDKDTNYPFSTDEYRNFFNHTLWIVPGVKEAKALSKLLKKHHIFEHFDVVNVAGEGDEEVDSSDALKALHNAMTDHPENTRTITLSCGRLTTGVTVPEWTAVLYLAGSYSTAASQYLQTIFRVQSPANINGRIKENCYVFDFAPDRTLKMVAESVQLSSRAGANNTTSEKTLVAFLNYCPVISIEGSNMKEFKVAELLQELKKAYVERVQRNGFDDPHIYNDELLKLDEIELKKFENLKQIIGTSKQTKKVEDIDINKEGFSDEELEENKKLESKPKKELTEEEKKRLEELKEKKKNRQSAISILRGISIRMPLLVYGMNIDIKVDVTIDNFADLIDDNSWAEFMPKGVTKEIFKKFSKYYDKDIFVGASRRIRAIAKTADELEPTERVKEIASLFATFKNPDKETVLTPWRVVNLHMSNTIGGYDFFDENHEDPIDDPRYVIQDGVTEDIFNKESNILEINSKTGLYPLYVTYSLYRVFLKDVKEENQTFDKKLEIWDEVVKNHIYVICKTEMAKYITKRTLLGYREGKINAHAFDDLIMQMKDKQDQLVKKIKSPSFWGLREAKEMKFNAVVGNPPYQDGNQQIYVYFYTSAISISDNIVSLIFPITWQKPVSVNGLSVMNNDKIKKDKQIVFIDNRQWIFPNISGAEWTNFILWKKGYDNGLQGAQKVLENGSFKENKILEIEKNITGKPDEICRLSKIITKFLGFNLDENISMLTSASKPYGLRADVSKIQDEVSYDIKKRNSKDDIRIYAKNKQCIFVDKNFNFPKKSSRFNKYKILIPKAWGNMDEKNYLGGAFADIIIAKPNEACMETYIESGSFDTYENAFKYAKFIVTKFFRSLFYINKFSQNSAKETFKSIPIQDFSETWWNLSVAEIDKKLFEKYNISNDITQFCMKNFQTKSEANILYYDD